MSPSCSVVRDRRTSALVFPDLTPDEQEVVFSVLAADYPEHAGEFLTELEPSDRRGVLEDRSGQDIALLLESMSVDDAVEIVDELPDDLRDEVMEVVERRDLAEVQIQLTYAEDTAGRIMDPEYFALQRGTLVHEAIDAIQEARDVAMIFYLYVVDEDHRLVGVTSLRQLLLARRDQALDEMMTRSVIKVGHAHRSGGARRARRSLRPAGDSGHRRRQSTGRYRHGRRHHGHRHRGGRRGPVQDGRYLRRRVALSESARGASP